MGQKPETSAVPPKLTKIVRSATCHHTSFLGNGGKARRCLLNCPVRPALHGPFHERLSAALSLPAARWGKCPFVYLLRVIGFGFELGASIRRPRANVKRKFAVSSKKLKISRTFPTKTANRTSAASDVYKRQGKLCCISYWIFFGFAPIIRDRKEVSGYDCRRNAMGIRR